MQTDKLIDGLFKGRKSTILVFDGLSTSRKSINYCKQSDGISNFKKSINYWFQLVSTG